jgi:catechol 2,3-dioxygenase-like lactoylglutathione lyase family enzyme
MENHMKTQDIGLIGGIYDIGVGVTDMAAAKIFWQSCGYRPGPEGMLNASQAKALYGVDSAVTCVRMLHQDATAGLIRLMKWDNPTGPGLQMASLRTHGCRWSVHRTDNIANAYAHGEILRMQGKPIHLVGPHYNFNLAKPAAEKKPFEEQLPVSGDVLMFQPEAQFVAMTRMNFSVPKYGTINETAPLRVTEGCHMAIVIQGDDLSIFDFYEDVIGFKRYHQTDIAYQPGRMASDMFELTPDESFSEVDFDDPEAGDDYTEHLPGRLRCFLMRSPNSPDDRLARSQPGNLGYSFYSVQVKDIAAMHASISESQARNVSELLNDEFGTPTFSFVAPDGFTWAVMAHVA